jgi:hypothetical protein
MLLIYISSEMLVCVCVCVLFQTIDLKRAFDVSTNKKKKKIEKIKTHTVVFERILLVLYVLDRYI